MSSYVVPMTSYSAPEKETSYSVPAQETSYSVPVKETSYSVPEKEISYSVPAKETSYYVPDKETKTTTQTPPHSSKMPLFGMALFSGQKVYTFFHTHYRPA